MDNISRNPYPEAVLEIIRRGGLILDNGAGYPLEKFNFNNVIQLEITKYPTTDVIGDGEWLPFKSNTFDAVISCSVLEHVKNPFAYVAEINRVLKPGGEVYLDSAFLQPVHAYPSHYFNTTLMALQMLFQDFEGNASVGPHQMPLFALRWVLNSYANGFQRPEDQDKFLQMKVSDILGTLNNDDINFFNALRPDVITRLAAGVNFRGFKSKLTAERNLKRAVRCYKENGALYTCKRIIKFLTS